MPANVPYARLERAQDIVREQYPNATRVRALWTPAGASEIVVEVWHGRSAQSVAVNA